MSLLLRHRVSVRFRDCDPLGHVNHAVYLTYLEQARFTLWRTQLAPADPGRERGGAGVGIILARAEVDYRSQARYGDELEVRLSLDAIGRTSFTYVYELVDVPSGRLVANARTVLVHFDYDREKSLPIGDDLRAKLATPVDDRPTTDDA
jgi:acyl-CoA thioester hydrolase